VADVARVAAEITIVRKLARPTRVADINPAAQTILKNAGVIGRTNRRSCDIGTVVGRVLGPTLRQSDWRPLFGKSQYKQAALRFSVWSAYADTDPTAWVSLTDTINDLLLDQLFKHDKSLGAYTLGNIGGVLNAPQSRLARSHPQLYRACKSLHQHRLSSDLAHPIRRDNGLPTRRIRYRELRQLKLILADGWIELLDRW